MHRSGWSAPMYRLGGSLRARKVPVHAPRERYIGKFPPHPAFRRDLTDTSVGDERRTSPVARSGETEANTSGEPRPNALWRDLIDLSIETGLRAPVVRNSPDAYTLRTPSDRARESREGPRRPAGEPEWPKLPVPCSSSTTRRRFVAC